MRGGRGKREREGEWKKVIRTGGWERKGEESGIGGGRASRESAWAGSAGGC